MTVSEALYMFSRHMMVCALCILAFSIGLSISPNTMQMDTPPTKPACEYRQPADVPNWSGLMVGPDADHLEYLSRAQIRQRTKDLAWWRQGHDIWLTCTREP